MSSLRRPKSDAGTILVHWAIVATLFAAALTGLSIAAADNPDLLAVRYLGFLLPGENLWYLHLGFGSALLGSLAAYAVYVRQARLTGRLQLSKGWFQAVFRGGRSCWAALNIILYWLLFVALAVSVLTGVLLFLGWGGAVLSIHLHATWLFLAFLFLHPLIHWAYGGESQLLRIFRPQWRLPRQVPSLVDALIDRVQQLEIEKAVLTPAGDHSFGGAASAGKSSLATSVVRPLAIAAGVGALMAVFFVSTEKPTRQTLRVVKISPAAAPPINGDVSGGAWRWAPVTAVLTQHGANFDHGESTVEVRALHDGTFAYFAFTWTDPTRSLKHMPLLKQADGWHLLRTASAGNETQLYEDKFAVLLAAGGDPIVGKGIHLGRHPLPDKPAAATGRGLHFIQNGSGDVWQWRASHSASGLVDKGHFGAPLAASTVKPGGRYPGGIVLDSHGKNLEDNFEVLDNQQSFPLIRPHRIPDTRTRIFSSQLVNLDPEVSDAASASFWLTPNDSVPYSEDLDRVIPIGSLIPSVLIMAGDSKPSDSAAVVGSANWTGGRWSLELRRRLNTGAAPDVAIKSGTLMWVAAFDHAETWHTYHIRPLELEVE